MRALTAFLALIVGTLLLTAALSYPAYLAVHALNPAWPFHKIASRLWLVLAVAGAAWLGRQLKLKGRADWGYGGTRAAFLGDFGRGFGAGVVTMLPVAALLIALGARPLAPVGAARLAHLLVSGLLSGLAVAFVEETLFRGLLQGAVEREFRGRRVAAAVGIGLVAVLYAALHFLARITIPEAEVGPWSGFTLLAAVGDQFADFGAITDSFLALLAVGVLLGVARRHTGTIALATGLHAGWVLVMRVVVGATARPETARYAWLVSHSDGFTGWLVTAWTVALLALLARGWRPPYVTRPT